MSSINLKRMRDDLDSMYSKLNEFQESKFDNVKDSFDKLKFQLNEKLSKFQALLSQKQRYEKSNKGKDIMEKKKIENILEQLDKEIKNDIINLEKEWKAQKKKNYPDIKEKEKNLNLFKGMIKILEEKYKGKNIDDEESDNKTQMVPIDEFLKNNKIKENSEQREIYVEEENKIGEWNEQKKEQDKQLEEISKALKLIKIEAENTLKIIEETNKKTGKLGNKMTNANTELDKQNNRLKDLINKIRAPDKICVDIILILIVLGLISVLYSIIKNRY